LKKSTAIKENEQNSDFIRQIVLESILDKKGNEIVCIDLTQIAEAVSDKFIICEGTSTTQVCGIANGIVEKLAKDFKIYPLHLEGMNSQEWVLLDYFDVVVHIFLREKRNFYQLEELWSDAEIIYYDEMGNPKNVLTA